MGPQCRLLNMGIFRGSSHKINRRWIQVQVNGSTGLGPGPGGAAKGCPPAFSDRSGQAGSHSGSTWLPRPLPGSWRRLLFLDVSKGEPCFDKEMPRGDGSRQRWYRESVIPLTSHSFIHQHSSSPSYITRRQWY